MSKKSYLSQQIKLIGLTTDDLLTDQQNEIFKQIFTYVDAINKQSDKLKLVQLKQKKKEVQTKFDQLILSHAGTPRRVNFQRVMFVKRDEEYPKGITWNSLKITKRIAQFCSQQSRALGLKDQDVTYDKIIISWKTLQILRQIVLDGFYMDILLQDGTVITKHYMFMTASAGQLRTDKVQFISDEGWQRIHNRLMCGLTFDSINQSGGINTNKFLAYLSLPCGATDWWRNFDIDRAIVVNDFESFVTAVWKYIHADYTYQIKQMSVAIKHTDGVGVMLEEAAQIDGQPCKNFMVRLPWIKGLLSCCDYIKFCRQNNVPAVIEDVWGKKHDLITQNIYVIFTKSQFKLWNYYDNWDQYKEYFKLYGCAANRTNFEQTWIPNTQINYQMIQTLQDFPEDRLMQFITPTYKKIQNLATTKESMLNALHAEKNSTAAYGRCLYRYNDMLSDNYARQSLKDIKKRMTLDAKSAAITCDNKRLYALPDFYAVFQNWFMHMEDPPGLLMGDEVCSAMLRNKGVPVSRSKLISANIDPGSSKESTIRVVDVLRSPHLAMEHMPCPIATDPKVYEYLNTNGIYTSTHSTITKRLALDVDGDQLNTVLQPTIVLTALDNLSKYNIHTLHYEMGKAPAELLNLQNMFSGLKRAHDFSGIGVVSNSLTKLWNGNNIDMQAADWLSCYNNFVIDAAKTGKVNSYEAYPSVKKKIARATGGTKGKMPHFFQFSKNGRKDTPSNNKKKKNGGYSQINDSTMNRICKKFDSIGIIDFNKADVNEFNPYMLLAQSDIKEPNEQIYNEFCELVRESSMIVAGIISSEQSYSNKRKSDVVKQYITSRLVQMFGSIDNCYYSIVYYLFFNNKRAWNKGSFWNIFGDIAQIKLINNLQNCHKCQICGMLIPNWAPHTCPQSAVCICSDCGIVYKKTKSRNYKSNRCPECIIRYKRETTKRWRLQHNKKKGEDA